MRNNLLELSEEVPSSPYPLYDEDIWKNSGTLDVFRRFLLSGSKFLNWLGLSTFLLETYYLMPISDGGKPSYACFILVSFFLGGMLEPLLSYYPKVNKRILPIWNAIFQSIENTLLKLCAFVLFACPIVNVGNDQYQTLSTCIKKQTITTLVLLPIMVVFALVAGYMEYVKYTTTNLWNTKSNVLDLSSQKSKKSSTLLINNAEKDSSGFSRLMCRCINPSSLWFKISFSCVNSGMAVLSLSTAIEYCFIITKFNGGNFKFYSLFFLAFFVILSGIVEYLGSTKHSGGNNKKMRKWVYAISEFFRPSSGNWHAVDHLILSLAALIWGNYDRGIGGPSRIYPIVVCILLFNTIRSYDASWYKFRLSELPQGKQPVEHSSSADIVHRRKYFISRSSESAMSDLCSNKTLTLKTLAL